MCFLNGEKSFGGAFVSWGAKPVPARMCTWEMVTTFDGHPSEEQLLKQFRLDFPQVDVSKILVTLMTSLNSPEGRKLRYLVMMPECDVGEDNCGFSRKFSGCFSRRLMPRQAWLFGWADRNFPDVNGNCLFWKIVDDILYILVFFEGRLCHWSEEVGYGSPLINERMALVETRLERFRKFLKTDALYSRVENFAEIMIDEDEKNGCNVVDHTKCDKGPEHRLFKNAAKDSFWKNIDLRKVGAGSLLIEESLHKIGLWGGLLLAVAILVLVGFGLERTLKTAMNYGMDGVMKKMEDAIPVELSLPDLVEITEERGVVSRETKRSFREVQNVEKSETIELACSLPEIRLKGIVGTILFMANVDGAVAAKPFSVGDSLESFMVQEIERTQVQLVCGDSTAVISMR